MSDQSYDGVAVRTADDAPPPPEATPSDERPRPSAWTRAGERITRRPQEWLDRPWPAERLVQYFTALIVLLGCTVATIKVVHLDLVFTNNTPTGGDMGAHVMGPAYLRDVLLPS